MNTNLLKYFNFLLQSSITKDLQVLNNDEEW